MKIHHKNMKQISHDMQQWVQSNLAHLGVYECSYSRYDLNKGTWLPIPIFYDWYCEYLEKGFDEAVLSRLHQSCNYWKSDEPLYKSYISQQHVKETKLKNPCKFDIVTKTPYGFEMMVIGSKHIPLLHEQAQFQKCFGEISYTASRLIKNYSHVELEFTGTKQAKALYRHTQN